MLTQTPARMSTFLLLLWHACMSACLAAYMPAASAFACMHAHAKRPAWLPARSPLACPLPQHRGGVDAHTVAHARRLDLGHGGRDQGKLAIWCGVSLAWALTRVLGLAASLTLTTLNRVSDRSYEDSDGI